MVQSCTLPIGWTRGSLVRLHPGNFEIDPRKSDSKPYR